MKKAIISIAMILTLCLAGCGSELPPCKHVYREEVIKEATCGTDGKVLYECTKCDHAYVETIVQPEHEYTETVLVDGGCIDVSKIRYDCSVCGDSYEATVKAKGHAYEESTVSLINKCSVCGYSVAQEGIANIRLERAKSLAAKESGVTREDEKMHLDIIIGTVYQEIGLIEEIIAEYDTRIIEKEAIILVAQESADTATVEATTKILEQLKAERTEFMQKMTEAQAELADRGATDDAYIASISADWNIAAADHARAKVAQSAADNKIKEKLTERGGDGAPGSAFIFPTVKEGCTVSADYGSRVVWGVEDFNTGIDLAVARGSDVYAVASGTVVHTAWNYSYGNFIVIDHGNGVATLYAHAAQLLAEVGDTVMQGDVIAKSGTSGFVVSSHLHFEVRVNGETADPKNYITL